MGWEGLEGAAIIKTAARPANSVLVNAPLPGGLSSGAPGRPVSFPCFRRVVIFHPLKRGDGAPGGARGLRGPLRTWRAPVERTHSSIPRHRGLTVIGGARGQ